jgi:hypothetical protein
MKPLLTALMLTAAAAAFAQTAPQPGTDPGRQDDGLMPDGILPDDWDGLFGDLPAPERIPDLLPEGLPEGLPDSLPEGWGDLLPDGAGEDMANLLDGLRRGLGDGLDGLAGQIGELSDYHLPEVMPNGDILIRRRTPLPEPDGQGPGYETVDPDDPIDL